MNLIQNVNNVGSTVVIHRLAGLAMVKTEVRFLAGVFFTSDPNIGISVFDMMKTLVGYGVAY